MSSIEFPFGFPLAPFCSPCTYPSRTCPTLPVFDSLCTADVRPTTHNFNHTFKNGAQDENIPNGDDTEVDRSLVSRKCAAGLAARACVGLCIILIYFETWKTIFTSCQKVFRGKGHKQKPPAKHNREHSTTEQHDTKTQHHRTQHMRAGHHDKPQHTAGQQATCPDMGTSDKARHEKTTADNQTQQKTPGKDRQQHTAPASANEATEHHIAKNDEDNSTTHDRQHSRTTQHCTPGQSTTTRHGREPGNSIRAYNKGSRSGGQSRTTRHNEHNAARRSGPDGQTAQSSRTPHSRNENTTTHNNTRQHRTRSHTAQNSTSQQRTARHQQKPRSQGQQETGSDKTKNTTPQHIKQQGTGTAAQHVTPQHHKTPCITEKTPHQTPAPHNKTRDSAKHQEQPPGGGGGGTAPAHKAHTTPNAAQEGGKETQPNGANAKSTEGREPFNSEDRKTEKRK